MKRTKMEIANIRKDYTSRTLEITSVNTDPIRQFKSWMDEVLKNKIDEPNAMMLATTGENMQPSARIVLLRDFSEDGFVFYTNYSSLKGRQVTENPRVALTFFWKELERQVRVEGLVEKISEEQSEKYFHARPFESRLSAAVSTQSEVIPDREYLENLREKLRGQYPNQSIPKPKDWGGYLVKPKSIEFWQGRAGRLHDRILYRAKNNDWIIERLAP
jgi:pyridoxamine 5'-phosphate oxidase